MRRIADAFAQKHLEEFFMRRTTCLLAAAMFGAVFSAGLAVGMPLNSGLALRQGNLPEIANGMVQKAHGWHCRKRKGWYHGNRRWHRHARACEDYAYDYPRYRRRAPLPYYSGPFYAPYYDEWQWERRNWLWD
jgi:hypothetical protein